MNEYNVSDVRTEPAQEVPSGLKQSPKNLVFASVFLVLVFFTVAAGFFGGFALGLSIGLAADLISATVWFMPRRVSFFGGFCGIIALVLTAVFSLFRNGFADFLVFNAIICSTAIYITELSGTARFWNGCWLFVADILRTVFVTPFRYIAKAFAAVFSFGSPEARKRTGMVFAGVAVSLPFLCIIIPLLVSSDAAFEGLLGRIFGDIGRLLAELFLTAVLFPLVLSLLCGTRLGFDAPKKPVDRDAVRKTKIVEPALFSGLLAVISVFYLIYLFSQLAYFFSAFSGFLPDGYSFTYAEYARRGFFEMSAIAAVNLFLIFCSLAFSKEKNGRFSPVIKAASAFICFFTGIITATAFSKMMMYINQFGLTRLRVLTSSFIVFLFITFVWAFVRLFTKRFPYMKAAVAAALVSVTVLGFFDVNGTVAKYNTDAYFSGRLETVDVYAISELGDSGIPSLARLASEAPDADVRREAKRFIGEYRENLEWRRESTKDGRLASDTLFGFNLTEQKAHDAVK